MIVILKLLEILLELRAILCFENYLKLFILEEKYGNNDRIS